MNRVGPARNERSVVLLCQLDANRKAVPVVGRNCPSRESGAIEQDADVVMLLYPPPLARLTTDRESGYPTEDWGWSVAKQRNGETGTHTSAYNPSLTKNYGLYTTIGKYY